MYTCERHEYKDFIIEIVADDAAVSPREWGNLGTMVCWYSDYNLGDGLPARLRQRFTTWNTTEVESFERWININRKYLVVLPLYFHEHYGITISATPFSCRLESGQLGWIYITFERLQEEYNIQEITPEILEKACQVLLAEVEVYDQYLRGDVWGYVITDKNKRNKHKVLDSCLGFFGQAGLKDCLNQAKEAVDVEEKRQLPLLFL